MAKKHKCECPDPGLTAPFYMLTYADMMTLLMTFFVLLFSMSTVQTIKFQAQVGVMKGALGISQMFAHSPMQRQLPAPSIKVQPRITAKPKTQTTKPETIVESSLDSDEKTEAQMNKAQTALSSIGEAGEIQITQSEDEISIILPTYGIFDRGEYTIDPTKTDVIKAIPAYANLAEQISYLTSYDIYVIGHTDTLQIDPQENGPKNNTELGFLRAVAVYDYFFKETIKNPSRTVFASQGDNIPLIRNAKLDSERRKNRRVELRLKKRVR